jgi:hypothetical protein
MHTLPPYINRSSLERSPRSVAPNGEVDHPFGCHRPRISNRVVVKKLCRYWSSAVLPSGEPSASQTMTYPRRL